MILTFLRLLALTAFLSPFTAMGSMKDLDFDHKIPPSKKTWQYFFKMPKQARGALWLNKKARGVKLKDWSWEWRLAWVRLCSESQNPHCLSILEDAIADPALVVRAEAVRALGLRYRGTANSDALAGLAKEFKNPKNKRRKKPLFIHFRILKAIKDIGGKESKILGTHLASSFAKTDSYWKGLMGPP